MAIDFDETVYLVDDDPGVLDAASELVQAAGLRAKCFQTSRDFLGSITESEKGCVVLDVRIPDLNGFEVLQKLKTGHHRLPVIVITGYGSIPMAVHSMKLGALSFLEKPFHPKQLLAEILSAFSQVRQDSESTAVPDSTQFDLTETERSIAWGLMRGLTDAEMAAETDVSRRTVQFRKSRLFNKFGVNSRRELLELLLADKDRRDLRFDIR